MQNTTNYNLKKPEMTDVSIITDLNYNFDVLDETIDTIDTNLSTLQTTVSALQTKVNKKSHIETETITFELEFTGTGTIGTRGYQGSYTPTNYSVNDIIGLTVTQSGSTANYILNPFVSSGKIYLNAYRCITGATTATIKVRAAYLVED